MNLSICIPCYNEEENIFETISEIKIELEKIKSITNHEFIIIDDHSNDNTFKSISKLKDNTIKCLRLSKRSGSHIAMRAAIKHAIGDAVLCISADGQEDYISISRMISKLNDGNNIVWGVRNNRNEPFFKKVFANAFYFMLKRLVKVSNEEIDISNVDFWILDKKAANAINECNERNTSLFGLIVWLGFKQEQVHYERKERRMGNSKWSIISRFKLAKDWIISFSALPLKLITYLGISLALLGFLYAMIISILALMEITTPGWAETVLLILIIGGVQMTMIGIIGEYLWRTLDETRKRPNYFIENDSTKE